jgi:DNA polymerase-3 subunit delta'
MMDYAAQMAFLEKAIQTGHLSHGYIFSGTESLAFAVTIAKKILCKQEHIKCDSCSSCLKINTGNHPDLFIIEPDGASIKNAQIEAFQRFTFIRPFESDYKVAIVSQAHLMTEHAQNRLLKVLEEPPGYMCLIFLTKQPERLLSTVVSRCQVLLFEEAEFQEEEAIAEQAVHFMKSVAERDAGRILEFAAYAKQDKARFDRFLNQVMLSARDLMIFKETGNIQLIHHEKFSILEERGALEHLSKVLTLKEILQLIEMIDDTQRKIRNNMNFDLSVDSMLLRCVKE